MTPECFATDFQSRLALFLLKLTKDSPATNDATGRRRTDVVAQWFAWPSENDQLSLLQLSGQLDLVIIDVLAQAGGPGHDDRPDPRTQGHENRPHSGVRHDDVR